MYRRIVVTMAAFVFCLLLAGCGGGKSFSEDDFKKVKNGMTETEVTEILGAPAQAKEADSPLGKMKTAAWKSNGKDYSVAYMDGKVMMAMQGTIDSKVGPSKK